jgi:hypothetical protein
MCDANGENIYMQRNDHYADERNKYYKKKDEY